MLLHVHVHVYTYTYTYKPGYQSRLFDVRCRKMKWATLLIMSVQNHRELWDKSSSNYKDDVMKKNAWRSIAREIKKTDKKNIL